MAFVLSGMAGLIYESIWSRYLGLFVGHGAYAQILVLVIYLGGMSLGAFVAAHRSERMRDPLLGYAWAEAGTGLLGLLFHPLFVASTSVAYDSWFPALGAGPWLGVVKWALAGALILPQSLLLGATFPLMTVAVLRRTPQAPGRTIALFYFANSFGASIGALLSGFFLVGLVGLPGTVITAAALNLAVAGAALAVAKQSKLEMFRGRAESTGPTRGGSEERRAARDGGAATGSSARGRRSVPRGGPVAPGEASRTRENSLGSAHGDPASSPGALLLVVAFGTAVASFFYEIGWIRMLSLVLGSATRSFEVMLSAFILGLALGALWVRTRADRFSEPLRALGVLQWAMGMLALATLPLYLLSFRWMSDAVNAFPHDDGGYRMFTLLRYGISLAVMLPATFCAGTTLPLLTRALLVGGRGERAIGLAYGVNTLGSILGAAVAGLLLLPLVGLQKLLVLGATLDVGLGIALLGRVPAGRPAGRLAVVVAASTVALVALILRLVPFDPLILTSGVYRGTLADRPGVRILSYRDGRTATVSLQAYPPTRSVTLLTNGKGDASLRTLWMLPPGKRPPTVFQLDESTQALLAIVPLAFAPGAREAAVIGQGSGMSSHYLLGSPALRHLTTIEIEPEVIRASRLLFPANRRVFEDPRSRFVVDDAKSFFAARREPLDLIVSEPSNPWVSGVAGLFSTEFYRRVARQLSPHGVFAQWLHAYELTDDLALSVVAALHRNFRDYQIFLVNDGDMLMVATNRPEGLTPDWSVARLPGIAEDLANLPPFTPGLFEALRVGDRAAFEPLVRAWPRVNSDYHPILDLGAERVRFLGASASGFLTLHKDRFSYTILSGRHPVPPIPFFAVPVPAVPRQGDLSMSAALRHMPSDIAPDELDPRLPGAIARREHLRAVLASGRPPADWRAWVYEVANAEYDWHCGTAGLVDEEFYGLLFDYLARSQAPPEPRAAIRFLHDAASWRFAEAAREADPLLALAAQGHLWLPPSLLLDASVASKLLARDWTGALRAFELLRSQDPRGPQDLRIRLVAARLGAPAFR